MPSDTQECFGVGIDLFQTVKRGKCRPSESVGEQCEAVLIPLRALKPFAGISKPSNSPGYGK